jgi:hypothetical protein
MAKFVMLPKSLVETMLSKLGDNKIARTFISNKNTYQDTLKKYFSRRGPRGGVSSKTLKGINSGKRVAIPQDLYFKMASASGMKPKVGGVLRTTGSRQETKAQLNAKMESELSTQRTRDQAMMEQGRKYSRRDLKNPEGTGIRGN